MGGVFKSPNLKTTQVSKQTKGWRAERKINSLLAAGLFALRSAAVISKLRTKPK